MKESRFIELLNLYVDHQIGPAEAAELEEAILRDAGRRKTYRDYCRMQRACGCLFDHERRSAPASFALEKSLRETERKIVDFPARRRTGWAPYSAGLAGLAALAACVAVVLMRPDASSEAIGDGVAAVPLANAPDPFVAQSAPASEPLLQAEALSARTAAGIQPLLAGANFTVARDDTAPDRSDSEWMRQAQFLPVQPAQRVLADETVFETRPTLQQDNRVFRGSRPLRGNVEFTAFQFQR